MVFSSVSFLCYFLPLCLIVYYIMPNRTARNMALTAFSLFFYGYGGIRNLLVMVAYILVDWALALIIDRNRAHRMLPKIAVTAAVISNIGLIVYYKYAHFFAENFAAIFGFTGNIAWLRQALPIGISFFTFQALSYVLDVYRQSGKVQRNPLWVALYVSAFPQLIAGPIVRYQTVADEIQGRRESARDFAEGFRRFIYGFAKKVLLANSMGLIVENIFQRHQVNDLTVATLWIGAIAFTLQIYHDFSGYSDMAIGLGRMFGFHYLENFDYPYIADSITDFWRRWHISLSSWFRDYVYIPLGGNRRGAGRQVMNLLIVWFATGLWHGAAWNFVLWGMYYGALLIGEKFIWGRLWAKLPRFLRHALTLLVVIVGWVLFNSIGVKEAAKYALGMFGLYGNLPLANAQSGFYLFDQWPFWIAAILACLPIKNIVRKFMAKLPGERTGIGITTLWETAIFALAFLFMVSNSFNPFLYFNF